MRQLIYLTLFVIVGSPAFACRCGDRPSIAEATASADAIFVGRAVKLTVAYRKIDSMDHWREVIECEFRIVSALKGVEAKEETKLVITSSAGPACGYTFRIGDQYLVYARNEQNELETNVCMRTRPRAIFDEDQYIKDPSRVKGDDAMETEVPFIRKALSKH